MSHRHPTIAEINLGAFRRNLKAVRKRVGPHRAVFAVVKANAYGHGIIPISQAALSEGIEGLAVAFVEEGIRLRQSGVTKPIIVMAGFLPAEAEGVLEHHLIPVLSEPAQMDQLNLEARKRSRRVPVHIKVDTGMGRLGILNSGLKDFLARAPEMTHLDINGLMSHFADENLGDPAGAEDQIVQFERALKSVEAAGIKPSLIHMANSAAISGLERAWFNAVRPGIMLYGYPPSQDKKLRSRFQPVLTLKTQIIHIKNVPPGATISYGRTFTTKRKSRIAVLPIGYADGYSRSWTNKGVVLIGGRRAPVVGRVCMDMTMADVTDIPEAGRETEAVLIGRQGDDVLGADMLAREAGTIPYEILCSVGPRVPRIYRQD
ncbi:MAG TPA: alanine racemase [Nitrospiria bacterium]